MKKINKVSREPPTTIQDAIKRYYFNSTHFISTIPHRRKQEDKHKKANEIHPLHFIDRGGVFLDFKERLLNHTPPLFFTRADFSKVIQTLKKTPLADERTCNAYQIRQATK